MLNKSDTDYELVYERKASIFPVMYGEAGTSDEGFLKTLGVKHQLIIETVTNGSTRWYLSRSEVDVMAKQITDNLISRKLDPEEFKKQVKGSGEQLLQFLQKTTIKLSDQSDQKLVDLVKKYVMLHRQLLSWGDPVSFLSDFYTGPELEKQLIKIIPNRSSRTAVISTLTAFSEPSFTMCEEYELIKIAKDRDLPALKNHAEKWAHLSYDYDGPVTTYREFLERYRKLIKQSLFDMIRSFENYKTETKKKKQAIITKVSLSTSVVKLANVISRVSFIYDLRKSYLTKATYEFSKVLDEIARRKNIPRLWLNWLFEDELEKLLLDKYQVGEREIKDRIKDGFIVFEDGQGRFLDQAERKKYQKYLYQSVGVKMVDQLTGVPCSPGKISGRVVILKSARDSKKMKPGDILVAPMTTVDFLPAMRKASAIITDLGGITSHAAIVSRELGIPCVVGAKIATKTLKDGDLVDVDADNGIIKILN